MKRYAGDAVATLVVALCISTGGASPSAAAPPTESWTRTWGDSGNDGGNNTAGDSSGNVYIAGQFAGTVDLNPDPTGTDFHTSHGDADVSLSKLDADGNFLWAKSWGGSGRDVATGLVVDTAGNVYISGPYRGTVDFDPSPTATDFHTSNAATSNNIFLSKFDPSGNLQWARTWGPATGGSAESYSIAVDGSNNIYIVGDFSSPAGVGVDFNPWGTHDNHLCNGLFDAYLVKIDQTGTFQWARTWGGEGYDDGPGVAVDSATGDVYVAGMYASQTIDFDPAGGGASFPAHDSGIVVDVFLSKFDSTGVFKWVRTWGAAGADDVAEAVTVDHQGGVLVVGRYSSMNCDFNPWGAGDVHSTNGGLDSFLSKFDSSGTFQWSRVWGGSGADAAGGVMADASNNVYSTGGFASTVEFDSTAPGTASVTAVNMDDVFFCKFTPTGAFQWVKTWGGSGDDWGSRMGSDGRGGALMTGSFASSVDFNLGGAPDVHVSGGGSDAYIVRYPLTSTAAVGSYWEVLQ